MRTQLELWKVVDEHFDKLFISGLCNAIYRCYLKDILTLQEHQSLQREIDNYGNSYEYFLGESEDPKPRKEFIKKMIEKHESK